MEQTVGVGVGFVVSLLIAAGTGLLIGALARLALPGPDPMSWPATLGYGLVGSVVGGLISWLLHVPRCSISSSTLPARRDSSGSSVGAEALQLRLSRRNAATSSPQRRLRSRPRAVDERRPFARHGQPAAGSRRLKPIR